jgi:hypothetical protein
MFDLNVIADDVHEYTIQLVNKRGVVVWSWKVNGGFMDEDIQKVIVISKYLTQIPACG